MTGRIWLVALLLQQVAIQGRWSGGGVDNGVNGMNNGVNGMSNGTNKGTNNGVNGTNNVNDGNGATSGASNRMNSGTHNCTRNDTNQQQSSLRLCHTRQDTLATLATLSLSRIDTVRAALHICSEDNGRFIDASLVELMRHIDPVQSVVEVTREAGCVIELMTAQQRRAFYWLIRVLEQSHSLIPFCARELTDINQVCKRRRVNRRNRCRSSSPSVCGRKVFSSLHICHRPTLCHLIIRSTD